MKAQINWTRIKNDINGNPRYVCHFLSLLSEEEKDTSNDALFSGLSRISDMYAYAIKRAHKIGGRKFHNKQYGGGIVFQSFSLTDTEKHINRVIQEG